nr:polyamine deacetylase HDAC10 isoform X3 [Dasypus novemcinctus]
MTRDGQSEHSVPPAQETGSEADPVAGLSPGTKLGRPHPVTRWPRAELVTRARPWPHEPAPQTRPQDMTPDPGLQVAPPVPSASRAPAWPQRGLLLCPPLPGPQSAPLLPRFLPPRSRAPAASRPRGPARPLGLCPAADSSGRVAFFSHVFFSDRGSPPGRARQPREAALRGDGAPRRGRAAPGRTTGPRAPCRPRRGPLLRTHLCPSPGGWPPRLRGREQSPSEGALEKRRGREGAPGRTEGARPGPGRRRAPRAPGCRAPQAHARCPAGREGKGRRRAGRRGRAGLPGRAGAGRTRVRGGGSRKPAREPPLSSPPRVGASVCAPGLGPEPGSRGSAVQPRRGRLGPVPPGRRGHGDRARVPRGHDGRPAALGRPRVRHRGSRAPDGDPGAPAAARPGAEVPAAGGPRGLGGRAVPGAQATFHCARLAAGAALQLVDAVLSGAVGNGLALVRPPGHHSQRAAASGFCVFNNVALAAEYAKQRHGLHRILVVDWDIHHGQGTQYIFEDDPSVLYFSWHRYEQRRFWPFLRESDADAVGQGQGRGFTVNLPWNQVGMGNADYLAAFLHVLLPLAFEFDPELVLVSAGFDSAVGDPEGQMQATPECFAHLTQQLLALAGGRVCAVLEGGYCLESLADSVCMTVQALLGDPAPPLPGVMVPCQSALESIQRVRAAQAPYWASFQHQAMAPVRRPSISASEGRLRPADPAGKAATPCSLLDRLRTRPLPPVRMAVALATLDAALPLPPGVVHQEGSALREETEAWARPHEVLAQGEALAALGKILCLVDGILDGQVSSGVTATLAPALAATLDVAIRRSLFHGAQRLLCVAVGQLDRPLDLADDGRTLWLNIRDEQAAALSIFHVSIPLPGETGGFLSCILDLVLPLAYGFQPELVLVVLGPAHGLQEPQAALLVTLLQGPAAGRVLALVEEVGAAGLR